MGSPHVIVLDRATERADEIRDALETHLDIKDISLQFATTETEEARLLPGAEIILTFGLDGDQVRLAEELTWVQAMNAGTDAYPIEALEEANVTLTNASGVHAEPIAQQVLAYLLLFERNIHTGIAQQRRGEWAHYRGGELQDRTLGIIGVGAIGRRVAELGDMFDMTCLGVKRDVSTAPGTLDQCYPPTALHEVLSRADYIVVACPLTTDTSGMIDETAFDHMPERAVIINIARGEIVDETALIEALSTDSIRGAALDVFSKEPLSASSPLREFDEVVMTPHMAGTTPHYFDRVAQLFAENIERYRDEGVETLINQVQ